ncbi:FAD binding domain-containing protein [Geobacillus stearothermophilus]|uniref:FAD binding domain-containing protein n=1 Tax=Anoxybacillaceae TaxID=3120669 RepID=UPI0002AF3EB9|nr:MULTISPECIES: FAD binding domain-containing protein [Bacillaceae]AKM19322.1 putative xanthine dehydrogenase subunit C [Geobacillus sp. 12AMOR1]MED4876216.1 FAD binding domain-containing protein [Anoxybacillus geothermalis]STO12468.1 Nicotinate dehydrogenase FAD-subunit [[Flavobacterium] thermophilum]AGE22704.1 xanthine dehydrogenase FAD-binding subunit [Geobacillus sp. GHH01]AMQ20910.1 xanthine dehydrogenase [Geobacillus sp. JS12]
MSMRILAAKVWTPTDIKEAWTLREKFHLQSCFVAGGTLLQTQWEKGVPYPPQLISLEKVEGLEGINYKTEGTKRFLQIGAMTKLATCRNHPVIKEKWSLLSTAIQQIAAPAIRNLGTIGGNVAYGFGDAIPALLTMDAEVSYFDGKTIKTEKLDHWLNTRQNKEVLLTGVILPEYRHSSFVTQFYKKVGRREAFSGSVVTVSGVIGKNDAGVIDFVRLAVGGGDNRPHRLKATEQLLIDQMINPKLLRNVYETILNEFHPISDVFYSDDYRRWVTANIIISELSRLEG